MAATSWEPAQDQQGSRPRIVAAEVVTATLDGWMRQQVLPVAVTPLATWLMADANYTPPSTATPGTGPDRGRGYPRI